MDTNTPSLYSQDASPSVEHPRRSSRLRNCPAQSPNAAATTDSISMLAETPSTRLDEGSIRTASSQGAFSTIPQVPTSLHIGPVPLERPFPRVVELTSGPSVVGETTNNLSTLLDDPETARVLLEQLAAKGYIHPGPSSLPSIPIAGPTSGATHSVLGSTTQSLTQTIMGHPSLTDERGQRTLDRARILQYH